VEEHPLLQLWDEFRLGCNNYTIIACYAVFSSFRLENAYRAQRRILNPTVTHRNPTLNVKLNAGWS
jgi:hypothetical protein